MRNSDNNFAKPSIHLFMVRLLRLFTAMSSAFFLAVAVFLSLSLTDNNFAFAAVCNTKFSCSGCRFGDVCGYGSNFCLTSSQIANDVYLCLSPGGGILSCQWDGETTLGHQSCNSCQKCVETADGGAACVSNYSCTAWTNRGCGGNSCAPYQMYQTRDCTPNGCAAEARCVIEPSCSPCAEPTYPTSSWDRVWCDEDLSYKIQDTPDEASTTFDNNWGTSNVGGIRADDIGFKSGRTINFPVSGTYTFYVGSDDGVRVWIDGTLVLDKWAGRAYTVDTFTRFLTAGNHTVKINYFEHTGSARVSFRYTYPPDLITKNLSVTNCASQGNVCTFSGVVENTGSSTAGATSATRLRIDVGNDGSYDVTPATQSTGNLAAGATETETWSNAWTATAGTHRFEICADVNNNVSESNETNNCTTQTFNVANAQCSDGIDNDGNGCADYSGGDTACSSPTDNTESGGTCPVLNSPPDPPSSLSVAKGDYCTAPLRPVFSWVFSDPDTGDTQYAYQLQINDGAVLDTGKVISSSNSYAVPAPSPLAYNTTYSWRVRVWDNDNATSSWANSSFVTEPHAYPNPNFTWTPSSPYVNEVVTFIDQSTCSGGCTDRLWEFGDGASRGPAVLPTATHDYGAIGTYQARLTVWDSDGHACRTKLGDFNVSVQQTLPKWKEVPPFSWIINMFLALANGVFR
jgi:hypothetical protein